MTDPISDAINASISGADPQDVVDAVKSALRDYSGTLSPVDALRLARSVRDNADDRYKELAAQIIASVNGEPGKYPGFTLVDISGRASVNTTVLHDKYPDIYTEVVTWGAPYKSVRLPGKTFGGDSEC